MCGNNEDSSLGRSLIWLPGDLIDPPAASAPDPPGGGGHAPGAAPRRLAHHGAAAAAGRAGGAWHPAILPGPFSPETGPSPPLPAIPAISAGHLARHLYCGDERTLQVLMQPIRTFITSITLGLHAAHKNTQAGCWDGSTAIRHVI